MGQSTIFVMKCILFWSVIFAITSSVTSNKTITSLVTSQESITSLVTSRKSVISSDTLQKYDKNGAYGCSKACGCKNIPNIEFTSSNQSSDSQTPIIDRAKEQCNKLQIKNSHRLVRIINESDHEFLRAVLRDPLTPVHQNVMTSGYVTINTPLQLKNGAPLNVTWQGWGHQTLVDWVEWLILDTTGKLDQNQEKVPAGNYFVVLIGSDASSSCKTVCPDGYLPANCTDYKKWGLFPAEVKIPDDLELWNSCQNITEIDPNYPMPTSKPSSTTTVAYPSTTLTTTASSTTVTTSKPSTTTTTVTDPSITSTTKTPTTKSTTTYPSSISPCCCPLHDDNNDAEVCQDQQSKIPCPSGYTGFKVVTCSSECFISECCLLEVEDGNTCIADWITDSKDQIENGNVPGISIAQGIEDNTFIYMNLSRNDMYTLIPMLANLTALMAQQISDSNEAIELELITYVETYTNIINNLLRGNESWNNLNQTERASLGPNLLLGLEESSFLLAMNVDQNKTFYKSWENDLVQLLEIQYQAKWPDDVIFPEENNGSFIHLKQQLLQESSEGRLVGLIIQSDAAAKILPPTANIFFNEHKIVNSPLLSVTLNQTGHSINTSNEEDVMMSFRHQVLESGVVFRDLYRDPRPNEVPSPVPKTADCVFWDVKKNKWSNDGCRLIRTNTSETHCSCNHLTMFAIITDVHGYLSRDIPLDILGSVLCSASVISLFTAFILLQFCNKNKNPVSVEGTNPRTTITKQLCVAMGLFHLLLLILLDRDLLKLDETSCMVSGMILHYLGLATVFWMLAEGMHLYQRVVNVLSPTVMLPAYWFLGYGVPLVIVLSTITVAYGTNPDPDGPWDGPWRNQTAYASDEYCWLDPGSSYMWAFTGPLIAVIVANTISMMLTLRTAAIIEVNRKKSLPQHLRMWVRGFFTLNCILGITWVFGLIYIRAAPRVMAYIFTILNASQGVVLLILHCLVNDNIRQMMFAKLSSCSQNNHTRKSTAYQPSEYGKSLSHSANRPQRNFDNNRSNLSSIVSKTIHKSSQSKRHQENGSWVHSRNCCQENEHEQPNIIIRNVEVTTKDENFDFKENIQTSYPEKKEELHRRSGVVNINLGLHLNLDLANSVASECHNCQQGYDERCTEGCKYSYSPPALKASPSFAEHRLRFNRGGSNWSQDTQLTNISHISDDHCFDKRNDSVGSFGSYQISPSGSPSLSKSSVSSTSSSHNWEHFTGCYDDPRLEPPACYDNPQFIPELGGIPECDEKRH